MLTVPIAVHSADELPVYAERLRAVGAKRVFLCSLPHWVEDSVLCRAVEEHRTYVEYFQKEGFEVGIWIHAFGFGVPMNEAQKKICGKFTQIRDLRGRVAGLAFCPSSEEFCAYMERLVRLAATLPASLLMVLFNFTIDEFCDVRLTVTENLRGKNVLSQNGTVTVEGQQLTLDRISPYGFAAIEIV